MMIQARIVTCNKKGLGTNSKALIEKEYLLLQHVVDTIDIANGGRLHVTDCVARREGGGRIRRAARERAKITTTHVGLDVSGCRGGVGGRSI